MKRSLILAIAPFAAAQVSITSFERISSTPTAIIRPTLNYDYAPSAMWTAGSGHVWHCGMYDRALPGGGSRPSDAIFHTPVDRGGQPVSGSRPVLTVNLVAPWTSWDGGHACAPSVIRHDGLSWNGTAEPYLMYYECAPLGVTPEGAVIESVTGICLAASPDGLRWWKYSDPDGDGEGTWMRQARIRRRPSRRRS